MTTPPDHLPKDAPRPQSKRRVLLVTSAIVVGVGAALAYHFYAAHGLQSNLDKARAHVPLLQAAVANDDRFLNVTFREFAGEGGSIAADGFVLVDDDLAALKERVGQTDPPVSVVYGVGVIKLPMMPTTEPAQGDRTATPATQATP